MSLTEEQKALLQLLLEEREGYEDIATLLGIPAGEVRTRSAAALARLDGAELLTGGAWQADFVLGQAEPTKAASIASNLADDEEALAQTRRIIARLRLLYPSASLPDLPATALRPESMPADDPTDAPTDEAGTFAEPAEEPAPPGDASTPPSAEESEPPGDAGTPALSEAPEPDEDEGTPPAAPGDPGRPSLTTQQKRLLALITAVLLSVVIVVLALAGAFEGSGNSAASGSETTTAQATSDDETQLTRALLEPQGSGKGNGVAIFGAVDEETPVLQVTAEGLAATAEGEEYSIWLYGTDRIALRLAGVEVGRNGQIATQIELPPEALNFVVDRTLDQVDISRNRKAAYRRELRTAQRQGRLPERIGTSILRGRITGPGLKN